MTTKWKNVSPQGDLDVPLLGRVVAAGEVVELEPDQAKALAPTGDSEAWQKVVPKKRPTGKASPKKAPAKPEPAADPNEGPNE